MSDSPLKDADTQLYDSLGIRVHVSNAKAHSERGRVERKIRSLREMLERTGVKTTNPMTSIQGETLFARLSSDLNDLPIAGVILQLCLIWVLRFLHQIDCF